MSENDENYIGSPKRRIKKRLVTSVMEAMPVPSAWGVDAQRAKGRGRMRLASGTIYFVKYNLHFVRKNADEEDDEVQIDFEALDPANKTIGDDRRRKIHGREDGIDLFALENQLKKKLAAASSAITDDDIDIDGLEGAREYINADYSNSREAERLRFEMSEKIKKQMFSLTQLGIVMVMLSLIELLPAFGINMSEMLMPEHSPITYLLLQMAGLGFAVYVSWEDISIGVKKLLRRNLCTRSLTVLAIMAEMLHIIYMMINSLVTHSGSSNAFSAPLCIALFIYTLNRLLVTVRVARGFNFVAKRSVRSVLKSADDSQNAEDLRIASNGTNAKISYVMKTAHLSSYFENAFREDASGLVMEKVYPICIGVCFAVFFISSIRALFTGESFAIGTGFSAFCASLTACIPITGLLCMEIPISRAVKSLMSSGALLNGWNAVEKFGDTDALALNTTDIFPSGSIKIRRAIAVDDTTMSIEEVTAMAAAVTMSTDGALGRLFGELVEKERSFTGSPDNITYESEMGITGWVNEKRVFVGNRSMMEEHKVIVPGGGLVRLDEFEKMKKRVGHQVLYVAVNNRLVGVYLMEYKAANNIRNALIRLISDGTNIMIYTCDANIDVRLITDVFDIPSRYISILDNEGSRMYDSLTYSVKEEEEALLATNGSLTALSAAIRAAVRLKESQSLGMMLQAVCFGMGFILVAGLSCISTYAIDAAQLIIMQMIFVVISLISAVRTVR